MKKILLLGLIFQSLIILGQEGYLFTTFPKENIKYKAKRNYVMDSYTDVLESEKSKKPIMSTRIESISKFSYEIANGNRKDNKVEYTRKTTDFVYEKIKNGKKEVINYPLDSDEHTQKEWIDNVFGSVGIHQFKFPETPMKIGDTIVHNDGKKTPFMDKDAYVYGEQIFTLKEVKGNIAYFDIENKIEFENSDSVIFENVKGETGKLEYDFINNIVKSYKSGMTIELTMIDEEMGGAIMKSKTIVKEDYQTID